MMMTAGVFSAVIAAQLLATVNGGCCGSMTGAVLRDERRGCRASKKCARASRSGLEVQELARAAAESQRRWSARTLGAGGVVWSRQT